MTTTATLAGFVLLGFPGSARIWAGDPPNVPPAAVALSVASDPHGAIVYLDGEAKGATPLSLDSVRTGDHRLTVVKQGFLENSRILSVRSGQSRSVQVTLTREPAGIRRSVQVEDKDKAEKNGSGKKWALIGLGVAGAGAATYVLLTRNSPPVAGSVLASPSVGLAAATRINLQAQGANDPDGDALTFAWEFGDGSQDSGQSVTHVYNAAGSYSARVTVSDGKKSATATGTVTIKSLTGNWVGNLVGFSGDFFTWSLTQTGTSITGTYSDTVNGRGTAIGSVGPGDYQVRLSNSVPGFRVGNWTATARASDVDQLSGTQDWFNTPVSAFTVTRR